MQTTLGSKKNPIKKIKKMLVDYHKCYSMDTSKKISTNSQEVPNIVVTLIENDGGQKTLDECVTLQTMLM